MKKLMVLASTAAFMALTTASNSINSGMGGNMGGPGRPY